MATPILWAQQSYTISTFQGGAPPATPSTGTLIPYGGAYIATDTSGNVYFTDHFCVLKLNPNGVVTLVAGTGRPGYSGDNGPATSAALFDPYQPYGPIAIDSAGNIFVLDEGNSVIRKISSSGTITTAARSLTPSGTQPLGLAVDSADNLYFIEQTVSGSGANGLSVVKKSSPSGVVTVVAGGGTAGDLTNGVLATSVALNLVDAVTVDSTGNIYFSDYGRVRKVSTNAIISTIAGNGQFIYSGDGGLAIQTGMSAYSLAVDSAGNLYICDDQNNRILEVNTSGIVTTVAGNGNDPSGGDLGYAGDGGPAIAAAITPIGVALDSSGNIYFSDANYRIGKISSSRVITTVVGSGLVTDTNGGSLSSDSFGNIYISRNCQIQKISPGGAASILAGNGNCTDSGDGGLAINAGIVPGPPAIDSSGNIYIPEGFRIREISAASGIITTIAGNGSAGFAGDGGAAINARFNTVASLALDSAGNLYIADELNGRIRKISTNGIISTVAGIGPPNNNCGCFFGSTNPAQGGNGGQAINVGLKYPSSIVLDGFGNLYIADDSNWIREVSPAGIVSAIAGNGSNGSSGDNGPASASLIGSVIELALDSTGEIYFTDWGNFVVRSFRPGGIINTIAGNGTVGYTGDGGPALSAELDFPEGLAVSPSGSIYLPDSAADAIRLLQPVGSTAQTVTFGPLSQAVIGSPPFSVSAIASSGLPISFSANTLDVCTSSGNSITIAGVGTCEVTASQAGNTTYAAAAVTQSFSVIPPSAQTITFGPISPQTIGTPSFGLTATASSGLAVTFVSNTPVVCTVSSSTLTLVGPGLCSITATQPGNTAYLAATAVTQTFTVAGATPQTITFNQPPAEIFGTGPFSLIATASSGLPASFTSNSPSICSVSLATLTLVSGGTCSITASQPGNATYAVASSVTQTFFISPGLQTITFPVPPNATYGAAIALSATASSGLPVAFASDTTSICLVSGTAVMSEAGGTCTITASQPGNASYSAANTVIQSFAIAPATQLITFPALANVAFGTTHVALSATTTAPLAITYTSNTPSVCTVSGTTATILDLGTCSITASQNGNGAYSAATTQTRTFTIGQASNVITFTSPGAQTLGSTPPALSATASSGLGVNLASTTAGVCTVSGTTLILVSSGTCSITATQNGNTDYLAATPVIQSFTVNPAVSSGGSGGGGSGGGGSGGSSVPLTLSPTSITITPAAGTTPASQTVTLSYQTFTQSAPSFSSNFNTNQGQGWLAVSPSSGTMTQSSVSGLLYTYSATITIIGNPSGIPAGSSYTGVVNISAAGGIVSLPVTLNVSAQPAKYSVSPQAFSFNYQQGSAIVPASQSLSIFSVPAGGSFSVNATSAGGNWLSATATSANPSTPGTISVSASVSGVAPGTYSGQVTITAGTSVTVNVPVTLNVIAASPPVLSVSPTEESFTVVQGTVAQSGQLTVSNTGGGILSFTAAATSSGWLKLSSGSGSATSTSPASLGFTTDPSGLKPGVYNGTITVNNSNSAGQSTVMIVLTVMPSGGQIVISRNGVNMAAVTGGQTPQAQTVVVSNGGTGSLNWNAHASTLSGGSWLTVAPSSGNSIAGQSGIPISISANPAGLAAGQYFGSVNIVAPTNSPQSISVVLTVMSGQPASAISASTGGVLLTGTAGSQTQGQTTVSLYDLGSAAIAYTSTTSAPWLSVNPAAGSLNPGSNSVQIVASFGNLAAGLQTGTVSLGFSDGSSTSVQVVALVLPSSGGSDRSGALAVERPTKPHPLDTATACAGGKASFLIPVFAQPFNGSTVQSTSATTVQIQLIDDCGHPVTAAIGGAVQVTFSNGDPGINLNDIGSGVWQATWTPAKIASQVVLQVAASENGLTLNPAANVATSIAVTVQAAGANAAPQPTGIANAASASQAIPQVVAPGSYIAIYGTGMAGNGNPSATAGQSLPITLNGAQLTLGGAPLPLLYASATQVNAIVPQGLAPNATYPLVIVSGTTQSVPVPVTVTELQPGTYTVNTTGSGAGIVADALTGALITTSNPAHASQNLVLYATGLGALTGSNGQQEPGDGVIAPVTSTYRTTASVNVTIGGITVPALFSGLTPTLTALYQINVQVPTGVASGSSVPVVVTATDGTTGVTTQSNSVTIVVQ